MLDFGLYPNPTDTLTLIPFENSFHERYNRFPLEEIADSGYGSEENLSLYGRKRNRGVCQVQFSFIRSKEQTNM